MIVTPTDAQLIETLRQTLASHDLVICRRSDTESAWDGKALDAVLVLLGLRAAHLVKENA